MDPARFARGFASSILAASSVAIAFGATACGTGPGSTPVARGGAVESDGGGGGVVTSEGGTGPIAAADASAGDDGSGNDGSAGADGDGAASSPPPDVLPGTPITAPDGVWTSVPFPEGYCRDGTQPHLMVHLNSASQKVAIYEEGGGACFNDSSCKLLTFDFPSYTLGQGIFNFTNAANPIRDWNIFYVPYCTGDVHAGDNLAANPGPLTGTTHYSGYTNLKLYLSRILGTVPNPTDVLLTGSSAGGFGAGLTADLVARNMPASVERFTLLDDSGPPLPPQDLPTCLQDQWSSVWGFGNTVLRDCGAACPDPKNFVSDWIQFLIHKYANGPLSQKFMAGFVSSTGDGVISTYFGFGANNCTSPTPVALTSSQFEAGLIEIRYTTLSQTDRVGTFYYGSTAHTTLMLDTQTNGAQLLGGLYDTQVGGVKLTDWIRDLLDHKQAVHVGP
jgi:hypothetical protein